MTFLLVSWEEETQNLVSVAIKKKKKKKSAGFAKRLYVRFFSFHYKDKMSEWH